MCQNPFDLYTAQVAVSYTFDVWGLNRRTVESLQALADSQSFQVEAAYLMLISNVVGAAVQEASLRAQIDATYQLIDINKKMLGILRNRRDALEPVLHRIGRQKFTKALVLSTGASVVEVDLQHHAREGQASRYSSMRLVRWWCCSTSSAAGA